MPRQRRRTGWQRRPGVATASARRRIRALLPAAFRSHLKASIREGLLAFESLFDEAVKALEKEGRSEAGRGAKRIKVE